MKLLTILALILGIQSSFSSEVLDLVGGHYKSRNKSIVFECVERDGKSCLMVRSVLIKGKPSKIKRVLGRGKAFDFTEQSFYETDLKSSINKKIKTPYFLRSAQRGTTGYFLVHLASAPIILAFIAEANQEEQSTVRANLRFLFAIAGTAVLGTVGLGLDLITVPLSVVWQIPEKALNKRLARRNLMRDKDKARVYKNNKVRVSKRVFDKLISELQIIKY